MSATNRIVLFAPPGVPKNPDDYRSYFEKYDSALSKWTDDLQVSLAQMISEKHAPVMVPRVTIDPAHAQTNVTAASATAIWNAFNLASSASTTLNTLQTAVSYTGRGVLKLCLITEKDSGAAAAFNAELKITIDGTTVYDDTAAIAAGSQMRVVVGNLLTITAGTLYALTDDSIGLPFNKTCVIQYKSDNVHTVTVGWKIAKKA